MRNNCQKIKYFSLISLMLVLICSSVLSQVQSYPIKEVNGIEYYVYTVEVREGFYALKRKFDISQEEVIKHNPDAKDGLKVGQQVLIPVNRGAQKSSGNYVEHTVEKQQTLYAISKKYDVTIDAIKALNPQIGPEHNLRMGEVLKIPASGSGSQKNVTSVPQQSNKNVQTKTTSTEAKGTYVSHSVRAQETLFAISRRYNVYVEDIINMNPNLESTLKVGQIIKVPLVSSYADPKKVRPSVSIDSLFVPSVDVHPIRIAFLLPFMLNAPNDRSVERFADFYAGALMAINEAKDRGVSMEIFTYDTEKTEEKIKDVLANPSLKKMDFIIGPAYTNQVQAVAEYAKTNKIPTLIPFTAHVPDVETNPYLFQFNPGDKVEISFMTNLLLNQYKNSNIVFVRTNATDSSDKGFAWADAIQKEVTKRAKNVNYAEWENSDVFEIESKLKRSSNNLIIFKTDKFSNIEAYVNTLSASKSGYNLTLFVQYGWTNLPIKIDNVNISPFKKDINEGRLNSFEQQYSNFFDRNASASSPRYDLLGYDLTAFFVKQLDENKDNNDDWKFSLSYPDGLQSQFQFERKDKRSGYVNQRMYLTETEAQ